MTAAQRWSRRLDALIAFAGPANVVLYLAGGGAFSLAVGIASIAYTATKVVLWARRPSRFRRRLRHTRAGYRARQLYARLTACRRSGHAYRTVADTTWRHYRVCGRCGKPE